MNVQIICLLAVIAINILLGVAIILSCIYVGKRLENNTSLNERMYLFSLPINTEENFLILDKMIKEEIDRYTIYNFPKTDDLYINEDDQNKMLRHILSQVLKKISPVYMNKLRYIYNEEVIEDIIYEKVRDGVLNYTVEINGTFRDKDK